MNSHGVTMDIEYTWILGQGKNCRQFSLITWNSFICQFVHPLGGKGMGKREWKIGIVILAS